MLALYFATIGTTPWVRTTSSLRNLVELRDTELRPKMAAVTGVEKFNALKRLGNVT